MALTPSKLAQVGMTAPDFSLPDPHGTVVSLQESKGTHATVIMFICNHCPYVKQLKAAFTDFANDYQSRGLAVIAINSNDVEKYPDDHPEQMAEDITVFEYPFPYLYDESQAVAKAYDAACTPDIYLFDENLRLTYRGQFDGSRPGNGVRVSGESLRAAADCVLQGKPVPEPHIPSVGCNIKWKT